MTAAIIVTAGRTSGEPHSHTQFDEGRTAHLMRQIHTFQLAGVEDVIVIRRERDTELEREAAHTGAVFLRMKGEFDTLDGIKFAIEFLKDKFGRLLITHETAPLFMAETVQRLLNTQAELAVPTRAGKSGQPVMLADSLYDSLLFHNSDNGLEGFIQDFGCLLRPVDEPDEAIQVYVGVADSPQNYRVRLCKMRPEVKLSIGRDQACFGPGTQMLTQLIEDTGSMREACRYMGIPVSKGWKMVEQSEQVLGFQLVLRKKPAHNSKTSRLTPEGRELSHLYREYVDECKQAMDDIFQRKFGSFIEADGNRTSTRSEFRLKSMSN